jgi:hypothetical protein
VRRPARAGLGARPGYTLAELLVAAIAGGLVSATAVALGARTRSATGREAARAAARAQLRTAVSVVSAELADAGSDAAPDGADLAELSDSAVDVRATIGGSVVCATTAGPGTGSTLDLAASRPGLAWWSAQPRDGDVVLVHDLGPAPGPADDAWTARAVRGAVPASTACAGSPFAGAAGETPWRLTLDGPPLPARIAAGAPVRVLRRRRYALYRGGDNLWALGLREWEAGGWQGVQPLAGPFDAPSAGGMRVTVRGAGGTPWAGGTLPAGAEVTVTFAASRRWGARAWRDSARAVVRLRGDGVAP